MITGTPEFFDTRQGVAGLAPLHDRIRFLKQGRFASLRQAQLELTPFDAERLKAVALRLANCSRPRSDTAGYAHQYGLCRSSGRRCHGGLQGRCRRRPTAVPARVRHSDGSGRRTPGLRPGDRIRVFAIGFEARRGACLDRIPLRSRTKSRRLVPQEDVGECLLPLRRDCSKRLCPAGLVSLRGPAKRDRRFWTG